jgi:putative ABC transport system substrate-binding protein
MRRRDFVKAIAGSAIAWPLAARAQQPMRPAVGFLQPGSLADSQHYAAAFQRGLKVNGYVDGESVTTEYRWAEGSYERLPQLVQDLVNRKVAVIAAGGPPATLAAKAATSTIPIVFITGDDPVKGGLVASFNRPGGNLTGVIVFATAAMWSKRLELLRDLVPRAVSVAILANPQDPVGPGMADMTAAAQALGMQLSFLTATTDAEIEAAFAAAVEQRIEALVVSDRPFFTVRHKQIAAVEARYALPVVHGWREYVAAGGLMSYGSSLTDAWHQVGLYAGRILKGEKPADLPVVQPSKFELVINLKTARALGLEVPPALLARADEVIE